MTRFCDALVRRDAICREKLKLKSKKVSPCKKKKKRKRKIYHSVGVALTSMNNHDFIPRRTDVDETS